MIENTFFRTIFSTDDHICRGNMYATAVDPVFPVSPGFEFFTVNALDSVRDHMHMKKDNYSEFTPRRADMNVSTFRNFVYEMDGLSLEDQRALLKACNVPWTTITYSGGKSLHAILSLENPLEVEAHTFEALYAYKNIWHRVCAYINKVAGEMGLRDKDNPSVIDTSCANPSRFTRYPNSKRSDKGTIQEVEYIGSRWNSLLFNNFLDQCPQVHMSSYEYVNLDRPEKVVETERDFKNLAVPKLYYDYIKYATWAAETGGYNMTWRICMWAIDDINPSKDLMIELFDKYVIPRLRLKRYNDQTFRKIYVAIDHAFKEGEAKYGRR